MDNSNGFPYSVITDKYGNSFSCGYFEDTIFFGSYKLYSRNTYMTNYDWNPYLVKYDSAGNVRWADQGYCPGTSIGYNQSVAQDNFGHVYQAGYYRDTISFGSYTLSFNVKNTVGGYLVKTDAGTGNVLYAKQLFKYISLPSFSHSNGVTTDTKGNVYITGDFDHTMVFGPDTLKSAAYDDAFIVKYDSAGNKKWARQSNSRFGSACCGQSICTDRTGNIYVMGLIFDSVYFNSNLLVVGGPKYNNYGVFIAKYDSTGNLIWARQSKSVDTSSYSGTTSFVSSGTAISADNAGNVYVTGPFIGSVSFGTHILYSDSMDIFLAKYNSNGNADWVLEGNRLDSNNWWGYSVATDTLNHVYLSAGIFLRYSYDYSNQAKIVFGSDTFRYVSPIGPGLIVEFDTSGKTLCGSIVKGPGSFPIPLSSDASGRYINFCGSLTDTAVFGPDTLIPIIAGTPFMARWVSCQNNEITNSTQIKSNNEVTVCPNPANGRFIVYLQNTNEPAQAEIYDISGACVYKTKINSNKTEINIETQPAGIYFLRVITERGALAGEGKIVVQK